MELLIKFVEPAFKVLMLLTAVCWWFFHSRSRAKKLARELEIAKADLMFLLAVEWEYGEEFKVLHGQSLKNQIRNRVKMTGLQWSGKFTKGRVQLRKNEPVEPDTKMAVIDKLLK